MQYELFYLTGASKEGELDSIKNEVEKIVGNAGGNFLEKETLEKRRLSYIVKKETHGIYVAKRFELEDSENIKEITNKLNLNGNVLRFIISKASDLPELKSKEERMSESTRDVVKEMKKEKTISKKSEPKVEAAEPKKDTKTENIDQKLEEILNI